MFTNTAVNLASSPQLLPSEVSVQSSFLFGRAQNYPIFSWAWYRYRSRAIFTLIVAATFLISAYIIPQLLSKGYGLGMLFLFLEAWVVSASCLALIGPGLAVMV